MNHTTHSNDETLNITMHTQQTQDALSLENQVAILLWKVWPPCLLLVGGFGNIATIFVMRRIKDNNSSQHVILMGLAMSDFILLYAGLLRQWLVYFLKVDLFSLHAVICKLCEWLIYACSTSSSWLLTCVTVQRTMAVKWPHKMRMMCSLQRTWTVVAVVVTVACALHCHFLFGMVISNDNTCGFRSIWYEDFVLHVWAWVLLTVYSFLPSVCLIICDIMLSLTLFNASSSTSMTVNTTSNSSHIHASRRKTASRTTVMILGLSCAFFVLTMPVGIYLIWDYYSYTNSTQSSNLWVGQSLAYAVTNLLCYSNSAVNFLLYCFTGTKFRREFLRWICCVALVYSKPSIGK